MNELSGTIATELGQLSKLKYFSLGYYQAISGTIPMEIGLLTGIRELDLWGMSLRGTIPDELYLGGQDELYALIVGENDLSGTLSTNVGELPGLSYLILRGNPNLASGYVTNRACKTHVP
jgi:hypothetical protein